MMNPIVSIIIPCFNAERWKGEAIQSCLDQTYQPIEVIVIDDGLTDRRLEILSLSVLEYDGKPAPTTPK